MQRSLGSVESLVAVSYVANGVLLWAVEGVSNATGTLGMNGKIAYCCCCWSIAERVQRGTTSTVGIRFPFVRCMTPNKDWGVQNAGQVYFKRCQVSLYTVQSVYNPLPPNYETQSGSTFLIHV